MAKQQRSPYIPVRWQFAVGRGINSDTDPLAMPIGCYEDALNIHFETQGGNTTDSAENVLGNELAYVLPTVVAQDEITRFYFTVNTTVETVKYQIFDWNNTPLMAQITLNTTASDVTTTIGSFITLVSAAITTGGLGTASFGTPVINSGNLSGYVDLTITFSGLLGRTWTTVILPTAPASGVNYYSIITKEGIDLSLTGKLLHIGSYNVDGDLIIWSTPQNQLPSDLIITGVSAGAFGLVQITVADTSGIVQNGMVKISGVTGTTEANGYGIALVINSTQFLLASNIFTNAWTGGGIVTINANGVGEIGAAVKDVNSDTWTYTTLLRSREFNFCTKKQIKAVCERNDLQLNCYWTDNNNPYRRFYYQGAYITNGGLFIDNPLGLYFYGEIYNETRLFQGNGLADIQNPSQVQSGGALLAGNYRYIIRFLDEFFNPTLWTDPSGIFVVSLNLLTPNTLTVAEQVYGNASTLPTGKINQMDVVGIPVNLFKYMELGVLFYVDGTPVPETYIANRFLLNQTTTQTIQHTGNETNVQLLDINTLLATAPDILTGLNIDIIANRLVPSNTTSHATVDFSDWIQSFQYNLLQDTIKGIGCAYDNTLSVGEYQTSENTFLKMGFMLNETYRISAKLELLNGAIIDNFWFDDIKFDQFWTLTYNRETGVLPDGDSITFAGTGTGMVGHDTGTGTITVFNLNQLVKIGDTIVGSTHQFVVTNVDTKRLSPLPHMNLTDSAAANVYIPYLEIVNIDWAFTINGVQAKDVVKRIHWEMVEMLPQYQEVLGSGVIVMSTQYILGSFAVPVLATPPAVWEIKGAMGLNVETNHNNGYGRDIKSFTQFFASPKGVNQIQGGAGSDNETIIYNASPQQDLTDFIFACGSSYSTRTLDVPTNENIKYSDGNLTTDMFIQPIRTYGSFYCPDMLLNLSSYSKQSGDQLIVAGAPTRQLVTNANARAGTYEGDDSNLTLFTGWTDTINNWFLSYSVSDAINVPRGASGTFLNGTVYSHQPKKVIFDVDTSTPYNDLDMFFVDQDLPSSPVLELGATVLEVTPFDDLGVYVAQIFRAKLTKFGDENLSKYIPTGWVTEYLQTSSNVYGDTFNQQTQMKHYRTSNLLLVSDFGLGASGAAYQFAGQEQGLIFYSQNRVNSSMIDKTKSSDSANSYLLPKENWLNVNGIQSNASRSGSDRALDYQNTNPSFILSYNSGYNSQQGVTTDIAFDPNLPTSDRCPARFWWSLNKPENSISDLYTVILPLNFRDLDLTHGEISHHKNVNGSLITWQNRHYEMQYFDQTGLIASSTSDVVFGDSGIATQRGSTLSTYGTKHGFSVIIGRSKGGKETAYWINTEFGNAMRFEPSDGTVCISDLQDMRWWFNNNLRFADIAFTPADGEGICGGWDNLHGEAVWTVRARKQLPNPSNYPFVNVSLGLRYAVTYNPFSTSFISGEACTGSLGADGTIHDTSTGNMTISSVTQAFVIGEVITGVSSGHAATITDISPYIPNIIGYYNSNNEIFIPTSSPSNFGQSGDIYISLVAYNGWPVTNATYWSKISHDNINYYNEWTIAYSEVRRCFTTFYSFLPKIYLDWNRTLLTPRPVENEGRAYEHYTENSVLCTWYNDPGATTSDVEQSVDGFISGMIINHDQNMDKHFMAMEAMTQIVPKRFEFVNKKYQTYMDDTEFRARGDFYIASIHHDSTVTATNPLGLNSLSTDSIKGSYLSCKLIFERKVYQKLFNFIMKIKGQFRNYRT